MKFNCGPESKPLTARDLRMLERAQLRGDRWRAAHAHLTRWHRWFAWFPVRISDDDCRWLEWIERRKEFHDGIYLDLLMTVRVLYRAISDTKD